MVVRMTRTLMTTPRHYLEVKGYYRLDEMVSLEPAMFDEYLVEIDNFGRRHFALISVKELGPALFPCQNNEPDSR
jgi:hypothetical protein